MCAKAFLQQLLQKVIYCLWRLNNGDCMNYRIIQKGNPIKPDDPPKFYMGPVYGTTIELKEMAQKIAVRSYMSEGNTLSVLTTLLQLIPEEMKVGHIVSLGSFGRFRLIPSTEGVYNVKDFSTRNLRRLRVSFLPSPEMRDEVAKTKFEPMRVYKGQIIEQVEDPDIEPEESAD
jgi:predicted histone-like DNA-binding protein